MTNQFLEDRSFHYVPPNERTGSLRSRTQLWFFHLRLPTARLVHRNSGAPQAEFELVSRSPLNTIEDATVVWLSR